MSIESKVAEARTLLREFGFDSAQTNERAALVLFALLDLKPDDEWSDAKSARLRTVAIMEHISRYWGRTYAPNSRETIRRFTLHQFVDAGFAIYNEDHPERAVNSQWNNYRITDEALAVIKLAGTPEFAPALAEYLEVLPGLREKYSAARDLARIPVTLPDGRSLDLSGGGQNVLIKQMVEDFCGYFIKGGQVVYIGDADAKLAVFDEAKLAELGVVVDHHGKLPDLVVYQPDTNWLFLMEAASTHGPVDAKRYGELSKLFAGSTAGLVYVSCFPDRRTMRKYLADLAWETEVWNADEPTHMIHLNGERFLGPYSKSKDVSRAGH